MGSLMGGWDSRHFDPKSVTLKRNCSLTKDEIDAYWRTKKNIEEDHLRSISNLSPTISQGDKDKETHEKKLQKSITMPVGSFDINVDTNLEHLINKNGWWTKSSWAFLNEPPVVEAASNKYTSQFHIVNNSGSSKFDPG
jgi:hypothetical protein